MTETWKHYALPDCIFIFERRGQKAFWGPDFLSESPTIEDLDPAYNSPFQVRVANQRTVFPCPAKGVYHCYHF